jgi:hypothetical protein
LHLPGRNFDAAGFLKVFLSFFEAGGVGAFQADQPGQSRSATSFQGPGAIGRKMAPGLAGVKVIAAPEHKRPEDAPGLQGHAPLVVFARFGLIGGINPVGRLLEKKGHHFIG